MAELTKRLRKELRRLAVKAHEEELRRELAPLYESFKQWEARKLDSFELTAQIHKFHQGPSRDLFVRYSDNYVSKFMVAHAIVTGILSRDEVSPGLLKALSSAIAFYEPQAEGSDNAGETTSLGYASNGDEPKQEASRGTMNDERRTMNEE